MTATRLSTPAWEVTAAGAWQSRKSNRFRRTNPGQANERVEVLVRRLSPYLEGELGGSDLLQADSYMEEPLRSTLHLILSLPDYQLG